MFSANAVWFGMTAPPPPLNHGNVIGPFSMTLLIMSLRRRSTNNCVYFTEFGEREQEEIVRLK
jgi:hypothetical protein